MSELDDVQRKAVDDLASGKVLVGKMGSGKSRVAAAYHSITQRDRDVYVITTAKKRDSLDWQQEFAGFAISTDPSLSVGGKLTVDSWNQIDKYIGIKDAFFIFDEQRAVGRGKWAKSFVKIARDNNWILLSATPGDTWIDYIPIFVANGFYRNPTEFKAEHVIYNHHAKFPKVDRYVNQGRLNRYRNSILVEMPVVRHTTWHTEIVKTTHDVALMQKVVKDRWHVFEERPLKDAAELFSVMRKVVNSSESRIEAVSNLLTKHRRLIVFYNFDYELEMLRQAFLPLPNGGDASMSTVEESGRTSKVEEDSGTSSFVVAEWNGHKHEPIPMGDDWIYLVQYTAGSEGWNCVLTDAMCFFSLTYSYKQFHQSYGRIDRRNTPFTDLYYYILMSDSAIDKAIWKALRSKRSFHESAFRVGFERKAA